MKVRRHLFTACSCAAALGYGRGSAAFSAIPVAPSPRSAAAAKTSSPDPDPPLNTYPQRPPSCPFSEREWEQRCALAVSYRIAFMESWDENIFNHITLKVEGSDSEPGGPHFLLNDFGQGFDEITASSLIKVTLDGTEVLPYHDEFVVGGGGGGGGGGGVSPRKRGRIFKPGYVLHSAIHAARDDVHAIWHGHALDTTAVCQTTFGLLPLSQEATYALNKGVSYHPFEGSANDLSEQPRLVSNLGPINRVLMLEDHGPLVASPTIEEAFATMYFLTRACKYQIRALSAAGGDLEKIHMPSEDEQDEMVKRMDKFDEAPSGKAVASRDEQGGEDNVEKHDTEGLMFACARRSAETKFGSENIYQ